MWLTDLDAACRSSGLPVILEPGWATRGHGPMSAVRGLTLHHTAGPSTGEYPSLRTVRDGVPAVSGPLAQLGMGRSGTVYVIAAGLSYHAGSGSWPGLSGNSDCIGIEAESVGTRDDWTPAQRYAWPRLCGALARWYRIPARLVIAHREWAPTRKIDPANIDMDQLRAAVAAWNPEDIVTPDDIKAVARAVWDFEIARRDGIGPAPAHSWLTHTASQATAGTAASLHTDAAVGPMPAALAAIGSTADDVQTMLSEQAATIVAAIVAAIAAAGGTIEHAVIDQAVRDAVSSLTIVLPEPGSDGAA